MIKSGLHTTIVSHALDGNFRKFPPRTSADFRWNNVAPFVKEVNVRLYDKSIPGDRRKAEDLVHYMVDKALEMEGTCTGGKTLSSKELIVEHGVGMVKKDYLVQELGLETVECMRRIKVSLSAINVLILARSRSFGDTESGARYPGTSFPGTSVSTAEERRSDNDFNVMAHRNEFRMVFGNVKYRLSIQLRYCLTIIHAPFSRV